MKRTPLFLVLLTLALALLPSCTPPGGGVHKGKSLEAN